jgi:hypothetical protein
MRTFFLALLAVILLSLPFLGGDPSGQAVARGPAIQQTNQSYADTCPECGENISSCIVKALKAASTHFPSVITCALLKEMSAAFCPQEVVVLGKRPCSPSYDKRTTRTHVVLRLWHCSHRLYFHCFSPISWTDCSHTCCAGLPWLLIQQLVVVSLTRNCQPVMKNDVATHSAPCVVKFAETQVHSKVT